MKSPFAILPLLCAFVLTACGSARQTSSFDPGRTLIAKNNQSAILALVRPKLRPAQRRELVAAYVRSAFGTYGVTGKTVNQVIAEQQAFEQSRKLAGQRRASRFSAGGEDVPPSLNMFPQNPPAKMASASQLAFEWSGGQKPFVARVVDAQNANAIAQAAKVPVARIVFSGVPLAIGTYQFQVQDNRGLSSKGNFQVVTDNALPAFTEAQQLVLDETTSDELKTIYSGIYLMQNGACLAGYQRLASLPDNDPGVAYAREKIALCQPARRS